MEEYFEHPKNGLQGPQGQPGEIGIRGPMGCSKKKIALIEEKKSIKKIDFLLLFVAIFFWKQTEFNLN